MHNWIVACAILERQQLDVEKCEETASAVVKLLSDRLRKSLVEYPFLFLELPSVDSNMMLTQDLERLLCMNDGRMPEAVIVVYASPLHVDGHQGPMEARVYNDKCLVKAKNITS